MHAPSAPAQVLPDGHIIAGVSTHVGADGTLKSQWIKTRKDEEDLLDAIKTMLESVDPPGPTPMPAVSGPAKSLNVLHWGDSHVGMLSWPMETGQKWNSKIAEDMHVEVSRRLLHRAPDASRCLLIGMGDSMHYDGYKPVTPQSGHALDADTRYPNMLAHALRAFRRTVDAALERYNQVDVVVLSGNHDPASAYGVSFGLSSWYRNEPRVRVDLRPQWHRSYVWGRCLIGMTHGDGKRDTELGGVMTSEWPDLVGSTLWRAWYSGHLHHESVRQLSDGSKLYRVETIAARDAYGTKGAWPQQRSMTLHGWHAEHGLRDYVRETLPHHRAARVGPASSVDGWDESECLAL